MRNSLLASGLLFGVCMTVFSMGYGADPDPTPSSENSLQAPSAPLIAQLDINDVRLRLPRSELNDRFGLTCGPRVCTYSPSNPPRVGATGGDALSHFADIPASSIVFHINNELLVAVAVCFTLDHFQTAAQRLATRYGPAHAREALEYPNTPRGDVTQQSFRWKAVNGDELHLERYSSDWDHSCITLRNPALPKSKVPRWRTL